ncbi:hypothetical protein ACNDQV_003569, partial [Escherichia coli]
TPELVKRQSNTVSLRIVCCLYNLHGEVNWLLGALVYNEQLKMTSHMVSCIQAVIEMLSNY